MTNATSAAEQGKARGLRSTHRTPHPPLPRLNPRRIAWPPVARVETVPKASLETHPAPLARLARLTRWRGLSSPWRGLPDLWPASEGYAHLERIHAVSFIPQALARFCITRLSWCGRRSWMRASAGEAWEVFGPGLRFIFGGWLAGTLPAKSCFRCRRAALRRCHLFAHGRR